MNKEKLYFKYFLKLVCFTWTVATQYSRLDERSWNCDLVKQAAVV